MNVYRERGELHGEKKRRHMNGFEDDSRKKKSV